MGVEVSGAECFLTTPTATHSGAWCTQHSLYLSIVFLKKSRMQLHNEDTAYLCNAKTYFYMLVQSASAEHQSTGGFTDTAWTLATEL